MFIYIIRTAKVSRLNLIGFSFVIVGGIGNIYDRILFNSVTGLFVPETSGRLKTKFDFL